MVSTKVKGGSVLLFLGQNVKSKSKKKKNKTKEKQKFLFQFGVHRNVLFLKFRVTLSLTSWPVLDRLDANKRRTS